MWLCGTVSFCNDRRGWRIKSERRWDGNFEGERQACAAVIWGRLGIGVQHLHKVWMVDSCSAEQGFFVGILCLYPHVYDSRK